MSKATLGLNKLRLAGRTIATQRHDVSDAAVTSLIKPLNQLILRGIDAREMGRRSQIDVILNRGTQFDSPL